MTRLIDAEKMDCVTKSIPNNVDPESYIQGMEYILNKLDNQPTIEAKILRHGYWIGKPVAGYSDVKCSICGNVLLNNNGKFKYCPYCGNIMEKKSGD